MDIEPGVNRRLPGGRMVDGHVPVVRPEQVEGRNVPQWFPSLMNGECPAVMLFFACPVEMPE